MSRIAKYVIFDFDGVVADTETVFAEFDGRLLNDVLEQAGVPDRLNFEDVRAMAGHNGEDKLKITAERFGVDLSAYQYAFAKTRTVERKTLFKDHPVSLGRNLREFVATLNQYGLATNKRSAKLLPDMELMGVLELFPVIVTADPPMRKKPAPDMLLKAASLLNAAPEDCAYIGDNTLDMQAAKAANMLAVGFIIEGKNKHKERAAALIEHGADLVIDDFSALKGYVEAL